MPAVIVDLPWPPDVSADLRRPDGSPVVDPGSGAPLRAYHDQLFLWVSLAPPRLPALPPGYPLFPVLLDTGFNDAFLMQERQAEAWMTPAALARLRPNGKNLYYGSEKIEGRAADLWLHPNVPGTRDLDPGRGPVRLRLPLGATLSRPGSPATREKPLIGLRLIRHNGLTVRLDGLARRVWVDTP